MKILHFTNLPLPAVYKHSEVLPVYLQGWTEGLRVAFKNYSAIELGYASVYYKNFLPFKSENATYFNIQPPLSHHFVRAWIDQWQHNIDFPGAVDQCLNIIDKFQPDVIHINGTEGFYGLIQSRTKIPLVISLQGLLSAIQKQYFRGFENTELLAQLFTKDFVRGTGLIHQYWSIRKAAKREIEIIGHAKFIIGRTEFDHNFVTLYNNFGKYFSCQEVLRPEFYPGKWEFDCANPNTLYCVSAPSSYKGIDCLLEAVALIKRKNVDIQLRVSGPFINSTVWPWIKRKIKLLGVNENITWLGLSSPQDVVREMKRASVFVHPSYIDNSPNSLAEAMMMGMPCIASYVGGIPSLMTNEVNGLMFPAGDPFSLANCIIKVLGDKSYMNNLSNNAKQAAISRYNPTSIAKKMVDIYEIVMGK